MLTSIVRLLKFSFPDFFLFFQCFDFFSLPLAINFNHFFNFVSKTVSRKDEHAERKQFFFIVVKRFGGAQKRILHFISICDFHPVSLNIQATARHKNALSAKNRCERFLGREKNFHLWSKQRVFKEACRCLRLLLFHRSKRTKNTSEAGNVQRRGGDGKNCRNVKN